MTNVVICAEQDNLLKEIQVPALEKSVFKILGIFCSEIYTITFLHLSKRIDRKITLQVLVFVIWLLQKINQVLV